MTTITPGLRLYSASSPAELIVVKAAQLEITVDGTPVVFERPARPSDTASGAPLTVGKRYTDEESGLLLLCTKGGAGPLAADGRELTLLQSKALPSSD